jgi:PTH1 family peptidyl-tRNA hydrolase
VKLIVGLGNPGREYSGTRHNIGFAVLGALARKHGINFDKRCCHSRAGEGRIGGQEVALAKPQTYMNLSGDAVAALMRRYRIKPEDILVVHDDLDLSLGRIRLRAGGSAGGHNGLKSIIASVGSTEFTRLKIGIGRPETADAPRGDVVDHVLSDFGAAERKVADEAVARAVAAVETVLELGLETAMNRFHSVETRPTIE